MTSTSTKIDYTQDNLHNSKKGKDIRYILLYVLAIAFTVITLVDLLS